jgi:hypothetical protein
MIFLFCQRGWLMFRSRPVGLYISANLASWAIVSSLHDVGDLNHSPCRWKGIYISFPRYMSYPSVPYFRTLGVTFAALRVFKVILRVFKSTLRVFKSTLSVFKSTLRVFKSTLRVFFCPGGTFRTLGCL